jgi:dTDP-4-amino-4,6-dideoxygalactose transaminase
MDAINEIADRHGITVVEDNAHGLFGAYKDRPLGSLGSLATLSFHETKNISCGEGGALLINDPQFIQRAEILREKGTNRKRFFRGEIDKYTWVDIGSSHIPSDALAAILFAQLEERNTIQQRREAIWRRYDAELADWADVNAISRPFVPSTCEQAYHMFYLLMPSVDARTQFIAHLKNHGIISVFHYQPLHLSQMGMQFGGRPGDCPVTEDIAERLVRLPFYTGLSERDQTIVIHAAKRFNPRPASTPARLERVFAKQ